jgi:hypothetical protein
VQNVVPRGRHAARTGLPSVELWLLCQLQSGGVQPSRQALPGLGSVLVVLMHRRYGRQLLPFIGCECGGMLQLRLTAA